MNLPKLRAPKKGLINGAQGSVKEIIYPTNKTNIS